MLKFDWTDIGIPQDEFNYKGGYSAVGFGRLTVELRDIYSPDILVNGEPNPVLFEDAFQF